MEERDMKSLLIQEFEDDPIYRMAILNKLEEYLFTDGIISMHEEGTYSTVETGKIIERSDSTIRNHFRSDLIEYIAPEKFGKYYRLNYKSVFRLHLIFLLMEKASKTSVDLLHELGMQPAMQVGGSGLKRINRQESRGLQEYSNGQAGELSEEYEERLQALERITGLQSVMLNMSKYQSDLSEINSLIQIKELAIENKKTKAELKYEANKSSKLLTSSLKKTIQKPSFFGLFKKQEEINLQGIEQEIESQLKEKLETDIEEDIKSEKAEIEKLLAKRDSVKAALDKEQEKFQALQLESSGQNKVLLNSSN